ncbi:MAG TPA: DUF2865 domain-containing protein [Methylovirgula sp.]|nr:DUF2865 domain-containing protein [Methylovirgula sp.]
MTRSSDDGSSGRDLDDKLRGPIFAALRLAAPLLALTSLVSGAAFSQGVDCAGLRAQIAALDQQDAANNPYLAAARKTRAQLQHQIAYAHSLGCDRQQFLFFGSPPPPQCGGLNGQIQQLQGELGQLEANARANSSPQRQQLASQFYAYCRPDAPQQPRGFFESLFGGQSSPQPQSPDMDPLEEGPAPTGPETPHGGSEVLCVRHCDGYFFPMTYSPRGSASLQDFCQASCPDAEVSVYTRVPGQEIQTAVGLDGKPYTDLPGALKYQKSLDPSCTCRKSGESWADTLAGAERILSYGGKGDAMVTPAESAAMARPIQPGKSAKGRKAVQPDNIEATDAAAAAQVPTATNDSSGIATGDVKNGTAYSQGQGQTIEEVGPDGVKRRVRIVAPQL